MSDFWGRYAPYKNDPFFSCTINGAVAWKLLKPSSSTQWLAIFILSDSTSYHMMLRVVLGTYPKKIPFLALSLKRRAWTWRTDPYTRTKDAKILQVLFRSSWHLKRRIQLTLTWDGISDPDNVIKCKMPKFNIKTSNNKYSFYTLVYSTMWPLDWSILGGVISTSRVDCIIILLEYVTDKRVIVELSTLIHYHSFVTDVWRIFR
jgi:hypothetical protein